MTAEDKLELVKSLQPGDEITIKKPTNSYDNYFCDRNGNRISKGQKLTVSKLSGSLTSPRIHCKEMYADSYFSISNIDFSDMNQGTTSERMQKIIASKFNSIAKIQEEINLIQSKLDYMKETQTDTFDETEFKAYRVLGIIDSEKTMSRHEKAKLISTIVK